MKICCFDRPGKPEVLRIREVPDREPKVNEVVVEVNSIGATFTDLLVRMGHYPLEKLSAEPPYVPGLQASGRVRSVGGAVTTCAVGDAVIVWSNSFGCYADTVVADQNAVFGFDPDKLSFRTAAVLTVPYTTAWYLIFERAHVREGDTVLIRGGAGGGVGTAIADLVRWKWHGEVEVVGTASPEKHERIAELGTGLVPLTESDVSPHFGSNGRGPDVVFDSLGWRTARENHRLLAPGGRLVVYGHASLVRGTSAGSFFRNVLAPPLLSLTMPRFSAWDLVWDNKSVGGLAIGAVLEELGSRGRTEVIRRDIERLIRLVEDGELTPVIDSVGFPLERASEAHHHFHSRKSFGSVVLDVSPS
jgi:NADPH:quinone reductase-like Zn-dependent oxidoreductase